MSVTVTLTFNSLAEMRKALLEVPESCAVVGAPVPSGGGGSGPIKTDGGGGSGPLKTTAGKSQSAAPAAAPAAAETKADAHAPDEAPLDYAVLKAAIVAVAKVNQDAAVAVLGQFGAKKGDQIAEGDRRKALAAFEAKLAELQGVV